MDDRSKAFRAVQTVLLVAACSVPVADAWADAATDYPGKPVRILVGVTAGGGNDTTARAIAQRLTESWGRPFVVDNRPGATGTLVLDIAAKAAPDGYTLAMVTASQTVVSAVNPRLPYDLARDLAPVTQAVSLCYALYHTPAVPVKSVAELISYAKANPGKLNYGTPGPGNLQHLAMELFSHKTGTSFVHVPYKGGNTAVAAALAGEVQVGFATLFNLRPHMPSGKLRPLAVSSRQRLAAAPDLPTIAEAGVPGYEVDQWYGVVTGAKVAPVIIRKLNAGIIDALKSPEVARRLAVEGSTPIGSSPEDLGALIKSEIERWSALVKDARLALN